MKNKIVFILILMLFWISTSCLAFTREEAFEIFKTAVPEYTGTSNIYNESKWSDNYDSFIIHVLTSDSGSKRISQLWFESAGDDYPCLGESSYYLDFGVYSEKNIYNLVGTLSSPYNSYSSISDFIKGYDGYKYMSLGSNSPTYNENYTYLTNCDFYDLEKENILFPANYNVEEPYDGMYFGALYNSYDYGEPIEVTLYAGDYSGDYVGDSSNIYINFNIYNDNQHIFGYLNQSTDTKPMLCPENFDNNTNSWTFNLLDYYPVFIGDDYTYELYAQTYNADIDKQKAYSTKFYINFPDDFVVNEGTLYDITPTITVYPLSASVQKTVTITSPVSDAYIYYKLGENGVWRHYREPFVVTSNTTVYAMLLDSANGQSASSKYEIKNIVSDFSSFENRPNISPKINSRVEERNGDFYALFYIPSEFLEEYDISDWKLQWNINNSYWSDYPSGYDDRKGSARYYYEFTPEFPSVFSFRFIDKNGFYSPSCTFTLNKNSNIPIVVGGTEGDAYDSNGNYDESKTDNNSMPSFIANAETPGEYVAAGTVYIVNLFSNIGGFFALVSSLFSFLPPIIIQILMTFLYVTFAIFVITIIKGIL